MKVMMIRGTDEQISALRQGWKGSLRGWENKIAGAVLDRLNDCFEHERYGIRTLDRLERETELS